MDKPCLASDDITAQFSIYIFFVVVVARPLQNLLQIMK